MNIPVVIVERNEEQVDVSGGKRERNGIDGIDGIEPDSNMVENSVPVKKKKIKTEFPVPAAPNNGGRLTRRVAAITGVNLKPIRIMTGDSR